MKEQRIKEIEEYIQSHGSAKTMELCQKFNVSKNTIRRDLETILKKGTITKVHGGVISTHHQLLPFENRDNTHAKEKEAIAMLAAKMIQDNDLIFIDSGTTTCLIPKYIDSTKQITIVTNNLNVITYVAEHENFKLIIIGNRLKRETNSLIEISDWSYFERININKAFMAATGVSISKGATNSDTLEYEIKHKMMQKAEQHILLADSSKFDKTSLISYAALKDFDVFITNEQPPYDYEEFFQTHTIVSSFPLKENLVTSDEI